MLWLRACREEGLPQVGRGVGHLEQQQLLETSNILILEPPAFL